MATILSRRRADGTIGHTATMRLFSAKKMVHRESGCRSARGRTRGPDSSIARAVRRDHVGKSDPLVHRYFSAGLTCSSSRFNPRAREGRDGPMINGRDAWLILRCFASQIGSRGPWADGVDVRWLNIRTILYLPSREPPWTLPVAWGSRRSEH